MRADGNEEKGKLTNSLPIFSELFKSVALNDCRWCLHRLPLLLPERDALIPLRHFSPDHALARGFLLASDRGFSRGWDILG